MYQIQMWPRFFTMPSSAVGSTLTVWKVPAGVLDLFLAFDLHSHSGCTHGVRQRKADSLAYDQRLRLRIEHCRKRIGHACWDIRFLVGRRALHQVAVVLDLLAVLVVELEVAGDLAAAFLDLLIEAGRAAGFGVMPDWKRSMTWKSMFTAPVESAVAEIFSVSPAFVSIPSPARMCSSARTWTGTSSNWRYCTRVGRETLLC